MEGSGGEEAVEDVEIISIEAVDETGSPIPGQEEGRPGQAARKQIERRGGLEADEQQESPAANDAAHGTLLADYERMRDRHQRLQAEFDNYRKRRDREAEEERALGAEAVLQEMLPILDNIERALTSLPEGTPRGVRQGIDLIHRQMQQIVRGQGIEPVDALGEPFDPRLHEAIAMVERCDFEDQRVIEQLQKGYVFRGRLLRPALVKVVTNPGAAPGEAAGGEKETPWDE